MSDPTNTTAQTTDTDARTTSDAEPVVLHQGRARRLGATSGMSAFRGIAAKRAERSARAAEEPQEATEVPAPSTDPGEGENGGETATEGQAQGTEPEAPEPEVPSDEGYDPGEHTVAEVTAYLDDHPDQATFVLDRERTGKARVSLIGA